MSNKITFNSLTEDDKEYIQNVYQTSKSRESAQTKLSAYYKVEPRTIRNWFKKITKPYTKNKNNVLVIGDIHAPFELEGYLEFCIEQYHKYKCNRVVFIGDIIDNHYSSYHETDTNGLGGSAELELAINKIAKWYEAFPKATVIIGNHDRIIMRKAQSSAIPKAWIKDFKEVLNTPEWDFVDRLVIGSVQYIHGEGGTARTKALHDLMSTVQGHIHTEAYTHYHVGAGFKIFGMQVGCGIDWDSYAMAYAKRFKKPAIGCGIILNEDTPLNILMNL